MVIYFKYVINYKIYIYLKIFRIILYYWSNKETWRWKIRIIKKIIRIIAKHRLFRLNYLRTLFRLLRVLKYIVKNIIYKFQLYKKIWNKL